MTESQNTTLLEPGQNNRSKTWQPKVFTKRNSSAALDIEGIDEYNAMQEERLFGRVLLDFISENEWDEQEVHPYVPALYRVGYSSVFTGVNKLRLKSQNLTEDTKRPVECVDLEMSRNIGFIGLTCAYAEDPRIFIDNEMRCEAIVSIYGQLPTIDTIYSYKCRLLRNHSPWRRPRLQAR